MKINRLLKKLDRKLNSQLSNLYALNPIIERALDKYFFKKIGKLFTGSRLISSWLFLVIIMIVVLSTQTYLLRDYYQTLSYLPGGSYSVGILGTFSTVNPIYASSEFDSAISRLIFAPLFSYNDKNQLIPALASSYSVNNLGNVYTVHLKKGLIWQDNYPITSQDVVFTYTTIQNPNAQSPLFSSWWGIKIKALGKYTVQFSLPDALASFPEQLTTGILPYHLLANVSPSELRSASFNTTNPIGSGPFRWQTISIIGNSPTNAIVNIRLSPFSHYWQGDPKLGSFSIIAYANKQDLINDFVGGNLNAVIGLNSIPQSIQKVSNLKIYNFILTSGVYLFFKTSSGILADQQVRSALLQSIDVNKIIQSLGYTTHAVNEPLLEGQLAYNYAYHQASYNLKNAQNILSSDGWVLNKKGIREKNNQELSFNLVVPSYNSEYLKVASEIKKDFSKLGVVLILDPLDSTEFNNVLNSHQYNSILYGISIGIDPDVFVYWDSSQASIQSTTHLNLSEYSNPNADLSLEEGRTRLNPKLRVIEYKGLLEAWQKDVPAVGLYQPRVLFISHGHVRGMDNMLINSSSGIFNDVSKWEILKGYVSD
jgi:peptide/nickel transport system substrate-binding protein